MLRLLKRCWWVVVLTAGTTTAPAFSLLGPVNEAYQIPDLGYNPNVYIDVLSSAPKNIGEEYRRNTPTVYYAFDQNFIDFFGSNGMASVDQAFDILNGLTNVSRYSADLSEFPLEALGHNYRAGALGLTDLKSETLTLLMEQLGLAEPDRYTWTLHSRGPLPGTHPPCPDGMQYFVIKRNFDRQTSPVDQYQYSSLVNGALYSYFIVEYCVASASPFPPMLADAVEVPVDPLAEQFTAVAARHFLTGDFYTGLTRDDVAGLRYLLQTNNVNKENAGPGTLTAATNLNVSQLLVTSNLALLVAQALTNDAATLTALYPGLIIASSTPIFTNVGTANVFSYFTNYPGSPVGSAATLVFGTNWTTNVATWFNHSFANVLTGPYFTNFSVFYNNGIVKLLTTKVGPCVGGTVGSPPCTNVTLTTLSTRAVTGEYFILPANSDCGVSIVRTQLVTVVAITNDITTATNAVGTTNLDNQQFSQSVISYFTNHTFVIHPAPCVDNSLAFRQGIDRIRFVRRDYDSLIGQFFDPITDSYTLVAVTNSTAVRQSVRRTVTKPDILFTAQDMAGGPTAFTYNDIARNVPFNEANKLAGLAGPGTIDPGTTIVYNKVGLLYNNFRLDPIVSLGEATAMPVLLWGSFDASTNTPVVYPDGTSIVNLENQVLIQVSPESLPDGRVGRAYTVAFSVNGGLSPYLWSLAPGTPDLPPGLDLSSDGTISGTPTSAGTYDIVVRLTDGGLRTVDRSYSITINP